MTRIEQRVRDLEQRNVPDDDPFVFIIITRPPEGEPRDEPPLGWVDAKVAEAKAAGLQLCVLLWPERA